MKGTLKIAASVPPVTVADCTANAEAIIAGIREAEKQGADMVVFPELAITGYTCGDLFLHRFLSDQALDALELILKEQFRSTVIVGLPLCVGQGIYDAAAVIRNGRIKGIVPKRNPDDTCINESRWFDKAPETPLAVEILGEKTYMDPDMDFDFKGITFTVSIGDASTTPLDAPNVDMIVCPCALPAVYGVTERLHESIRRTSESDGTCIVMCSSGVGESTTDFVFSGDAFITDCGNVVAEAKRFQQEGELVIGDINTEKLPDSPDKDNDVYGISLASPMLPKNDRERWEIFEIQKAGLAKRLRHTSCRNIVLGVSGGLDSTLALMVAVATFDMLGIERSGIHAITMPGFGTSGRTHLNAVTLMKELGVSSREISIKKSVEQHFSDIGLSSSDRSAAFENSQARERTQILMDVANMVGGMVLGTGDLSEAVLGWETYNGDHMSMYNVNCSLTKTMVRDMVSYLARNNGNAAVRHALEDVVDTPVSPELLPTDPNGEIAQKTEESVGPYILHDYFIYHFLFLTEDPLSILASSAEVFAGTFDRATIKKWFRVFTSRFFSQQYKRSAMPDGPLVGPVSLSPRGGLCLPSDASAKEWLRAIDSFEI